MTCADAIYAHGTEAAPQKGGRRAATLDIFGGGGADEPSFADGGGVGLSGGIETAIAPSLCRRLAGGASAHGAGGSYEDRCAHIERAIRAATEVWARHHPALYFNWTQDLEHAELVFESGTPDDFSPRKGMDHVLAFEDDLHGAGAAPAAVRIVRGTGGHRLRSRVVRRRVVVNPSKCIYRSDAHVRACSALGAHFALGAVVACAALTLAVLALAPLGRFGAAVGSRGRAALATVALLTALSAERFGPLRALQWLSVLNILVAVAAALFYLVASSRAEAAVAAAAADSSESVGDASQDDVDKEERILAWQVSHLEAMLLVSRASMTQGTMGMEMAEPLVQLELELKRRHAAVSAAASERRLAAATKRRAPPPMPPKPDGTAVGCSAWGAAFIAAVVAASLLLLLLGQRLESCGNATPARLLWGGRGRDRLELLNSRCFRIDNVLAHELGHALGLGHPDQTVAFIPTHASVIGAPSSAQFVDISPVTPCAGLKMDAVRPGFPVFKDSIMFSSVVGESLLEGATAPPMRLTEDDLAGLFFLYPSEARRREWGTAPIPFKAYSPSKLRSHAEDVRSGRRCAALVRHADLAECLLALRVRSALKALERMRRHRCGAESWNNSGATPATPPAHAAVRLELCEALDALMHGARRGIVLAATDEMTPALAAEYNSRLHEEQLRLEAALHDAPLRLTGHAGVDHALVFLARGVHHDADADGVDDSDRDADGLPDIVEDGLDALRELLREALAGQLSGGGWGAAAGDGEEADEEGDFVGRAMAALSAVSPHQQHSGCRHGRQRGGEGVDGAAEL